MNELLIKPDLTDLTEEKEEEDVVEESLENENRSKADCIFTAISLETALNQVITHFEIPKKVKAYIISAGGDA